MFRILLVEPDFNENGALRVSLDRARRWLDMGAEVSVLFISANHEGLRATVPPGLRSIVANERLRSNWRLLPRTIARGLPEAFKADVIVSGREMASGLLMGTLLSKIARRPLAVTIHSNVEAALQHHGTPRHRHKVLACLRTAKLVTPVSQGLSPALTALGIAKERIYVVENGLDHVHLEKLGSAALETAMPPGIVILGLGRLSQQKGFDVLIAAHAEALANGAPAHSLLIAGEGPDGERLSALAAELGVAKSVVFAGFVRNPFPLLTRADLFVLSSRWEGFGLALGEAVLLRCPSIAADCVSGPREILDGGRFGDLVAVGDVSALASAIGRHLTSPDRLKAMVAIGSDHVRRTCSADRSARAHLDALRRLTRAVPGVQPA